MWCYLLYQEGTGVKETRTTPPVTTTMEPVATTSLTTTRLSPEETATTPPVTTTMVATTSLTTTSPEAVQCPALTPPANGAQSPTGVNSYNDEVMFTCNQGYELEGASSVRCQANRAWSDPVPTCRVCNTSTDAEYRYRWDLPPVTGSRFEFEVQASGDVNVALSAQNQDLSNMYEVVIGGWSNRKSVIRRSKLGAEQAEAQTPGINSPNQYRRFWITWADGTIAVGRGNEIDPFIQWVDPDPLNISYAGYSTYMSSAGQWRFCSPGIRLMGGSSSSEGRVEVYHDGQWGTVCDDDFDMNDANVICRQLGYGSALEARSKAAFGAGSDPIWLDDLNCGGSETSIEDCTHNGWGSHNCGHHEDAGVVCSGAVQCPSLTPPANGTLSPTGVNSYNDKVIFTCNQGYELEGASSVRCQANRTWSDPVPTCRVCNASTDDVYLYRWDLPPVTGSRFEFEVQAGDHVHVALSAQNQDLSDMYEVVIGGWGNSWSVIRRSKQGANQAEAQTPGITSPNQYRRFWITWADDGTIAVGRGSEINPFLQWVDPNPLPISYAGYSTGWGIAGQWRFCSPAAQCPVPTPPANGSLSPTGVNSYNDEVMFTCNQGYELEGASSVRCQANQTWSSPVPTCADADECATANGRCDHICSNFPGGYQCFCRLGFVLMGDAHGCGVCGRCQGGDVNCDLLSGVCSSGCQDGWKTQLCDKAVDPPMDLAVTDITDDGFKVTWSPSPDPDLDLEGYRVVVSGLDMMTAVNQSTAETSFPVVGLSPETAYIIRVASLFSSVGWKAQSETAMILVFTAAIPTTTPAPAVTTEQKSRRTTLLSTEPEASTVQNTQEAMRDGGSSDDAAATTTATATTKQTSGMTTVLSTRPSTQVQLGSEATETTETSSRPPAKDKATPGQALGNGLDSIFASSLSAKPQDVLQKLAQTADVPGDAVVLGQPTSAAEEKAQDIAVGVLKSITSNLDKLDMSDPATVQSVGGSLVESVGSLLEEPARDTQEDDGKLASDLEEDQSLSPKERLEKAEEKEKEKQAEKRRNVQESRRVLDGLFDAIMGSMSPGAPAVTIERGGVTLRAQRVWGDQFGGQVVQMEDGSFHLPSKAALFPDYTPHSVAIRLTQFQQNPFTWGRGEYQARSSVMELSLLQNDIPVAFNNLTEDFTITIPGGSGNKPATTTITFPAPGNQSSSYHLLKLNSTAEGFLVTITPLNTSVVYGVWGRYGGRPDDQNYNMSTETYILPEECALMKSLSGNEDTNTEKTEATIFILGGDGPADYYIKVQVLGPVTECDIEAKTDMNKSDSNDVYSYQIQWVRLGCVYWSETQEDWRTDGCTMSKQSTITSTICHCNHLTAFGRDFATPPNTLDFGALSFSDLVDNSAVVTTVIVALCLFSLTSAVIKIAERKDKRKLHHAVRLDDLQNGYLYRLLIWTGAARHAGTESTVAFKLVGDAANSDVRVVDIAEKVFTQGSQVTLTFSTAEQLGNVELLQLMHDNSGEGGRASWHVDRAAVEDVTTGKTSYFFCNEWLAADRGDGQVVKTFPVASEQDLRSFGFLFPASLRSNLIEEHLFLSAAITPEGSTFTRSERLGCCLSLLLMSMVSSAMWLRDEIKTQVVQAVSLGPFSFTLNGVYTGIMTSLTCLPVIMAIILLFQYSRPSNKGDRRVRDVETGDTPEAPTQQGPAKGLPHWCKYVAWVLVVLSAVGSAVFTVLYSMYWGKDKSERWLSVYFIAFWADIFVMQPGKVLLLTIVTCFVGKTQAVKKIFKKKRGPALMKASVVSSQRETDFNCDAFRMRRKMERLSMRSLANIKQVRMRQRRDRRFGETVWDIAWFCCFLLLVLSIANEYHNTTEGFHQTLSTTNTFLQSVDDINDPLTFWSWLNETALQSFYPETSYNDDKPRWFERVFTADMQTVLVYPPSLIQGRVKPGLCAVPVAIQHLFEECSSAYDEHAKETGAFEEGWKRVRNTSAMESAALGWTHLPNKYPSLPIYGVTTHYWGDGFGLHLGKSADEMRSILAELKANRWIDKRTRVIFLEAMLYNGNVDLFTSLTVVFEFSETAGVFSRHHVQTFRLHQRPGTIGYIYVLLEIIYVIILLYTLWREVKTARTVGLAYLKGAWNIIEIFNFFLALIVIALYGFKAIYSSRALVAIKEEKDQVHHFRSAVNISQVYGWFLAFLVFVNMMKFLRLLRFNPFLAKLMSVFRGMAGEFSAFIFHFFFWMSAFGVYAYLMFGLTVTEYSSISKSFSTLFQMSLGNFYYYQLQEAAPILGPIFFFAFISIIFLVLMNIAMAIIDSALPEMRNHDMPEEDRYFIQGLWERFTAFFGFWEVPATDDDSMDTLHDSLIEVEIKVEKLWLKRQSLFNLKMKDADLPAEPEFVPAVGAPDAAAVELRHRVIKVRSASPTICTDSGSQGTHSESKTPVVVTSRSPAKEEDTPESHQTKQVRKIKSVLSKGGKSDKTSTRRVCFAQVVLVRHTEERKVEGPSVKLSIHDKTTLAFGEMLTDDHIQAAQILLRRQYPALQGLEAPAVGHCEDGFAKMTGEGLQIHHNGSQHWVLSSCAGGQVRLYDSLGVAMTPSLQIQLYQSYAAFADQARKVLTVILPDIQRQKNVFDCGLFAIAWAVDIAEGQDVSRVVYDVRKMRSHLETCFEQGKLTPFPRQTSCRKVGPTKAQQISLICYCEQGERLGRMHNCKACRRIFHVNCLPVSHFSDGKLACGYCGV